MTGRLADDPRFERLLSLVLDTLIALLEQGAPASKRSADGGDAPRAPAPAPYVAAAIRLLKDAGWWSGKSDDKALEALLSDLPDFDD